MSTKEYLRSLFSNQILPAIIRIIENTISTILKSLSWKVSREDAFIAYQAS